MKILILKHLDMIIFFFIVAAFYVAVFKGDKHDKKIR